MLHSFSGLVTRVMYLLYSLSWNSEKNVYTAYDAIFDVNKPKDTRKITCPLNVVFNILFLISCNNALSYNNS